MSPRRVAVTALLALALAAAAPSATARASQHGAAAARATAVQRVSPLDATGALLPGYRIAHRYGGAGCQSGSPVTGTAYRCVTPRSPQAEYDACWAQPDPSHAVCLNEPWQHRVVRLRVTSGYGGPGGFAPRHQPWAARIAHGPRCSTIIAPVHVINGHRVTYYCRHRQVIAGAVRHGNRVWHARVYRAVSHRQRPTTYRSLGSRPLAEVWFGLPSRHA